MFTGLIREIGKLRSIAPVGGITRLRIEAPRTAPELGIGDSVAVNGICLTVTRKSGSQMTVEAAAETRRITTVGNWRPGRRLHLEPALRAGQALDGHLVQGHVDGIGVVVERRRAGGSLYLAVGVPAALASLLVPKGSVAIDGVSLTIAELPASDRLTVNLIPHTLANTLFANLAMGARVNVEMDIMVKAALRKVALDGETAPKEDRGATDKPLTLSGLLARGFRRR